MIVAEFVLASMLALAPRRDHTELADAISHSIETEGCVYGWKDCEQRTAALMVAVAFRESTFNVDALGDCDAKKVCRSVCAFQIWGGSRTLLTDAKACALAGHRRLKDWLATCRGSLAGFASGKCTTTIGKRIDADRKALAAWLLNTRKESK